MNSYNNSLEFSTGLLELDGIGDVTTPLLSIYSKAFIDTHCPVTTPVNNSTIAKKAVVGFATVLLSSSSPAEERVTENNTRNNYKVEQTINNVDIHKLDLMAESYLSEIQGVLINSNKVLHNFTEDELHEIEIIDTYYKENRSYYPRKKKFTL